MTPIRCNFDYPQNRVGKVDADFLIPDLPPHILLKRKVRISMRNIQKLFEAAASQNIPKVSGSTGKYSVSVVNSDGNGKRITLSKALRDKLQLSDSISMVPLKKERVLMMAKALPFESASNIQLNSSNGRISYNAGAVKLIVDTFGLDYSNRTSMSFSDIEFDTHEGMTVAIVNIPATQQDGQLAGAEVDPADEVGDVE